MNKSLRICWLTAVLFISSFITNVFSQNLRIVNDCDLTWLPMASNWNSLPNPVKLVSDSVTLNQINILKYDSLLGYTHVLYFVDVNWGLTFTSTLPRKWQYNNGNYNSGSAAISFRNMKAAIEHYGMVMIPMIPSGLTHMDACNYIGRDSSISEFYNPNSHPPKDTFSNYIKYPHYGLPANSIPLSADHVAFVGKYPATKNKSADQIVSECLKIIKANWDSANGHGTALGGKYPKYVHIASDETGYNTACFIAESRAKPFLLNLTKSDLVARELAYRFKQVQDGLASIRGTDTINVLLFGDSYVPADNGQIYGLCGNIADTGSIGSDGVLYKIKNDSYIKNNIGSGIYSHMIVEPWGYTTVDGMYYASNILPLSISTPANSYDCQFWKMSQTSFLSKLGYKYVVCAGDYFVGRTSYPMDTADVNYSKQTTYEWVRAAQTFSQYLAGYSYATYKNLYNPPTFTIDTDYFANINDPNSLRSGFSSSLLAYCAWTFPNTNYITKNVYSASFFNNCNYQKSRNNRTWNNGGSNWDYLPFRINISSSELNSSY